MIDLSNTAFGTSIWGDEGFSAILSMKSLPEIVKIIINDTSPPMWNIAEWVVFNTLGTEEIYIRTLSLLFFVLTSFFVFLIGKTFWDKKTAILVTLLTAFNPFFFIYAFEGRMYSIMALGVAASIYFYLKLMKGSERILHSAGYVLATLWALYSHHFAIFVITLQGLWFLYELVFGNKRFAKRIFKLFIIIGLGYLPWVWPLYNQITKVGGGFWLGKPTTQDLRNLIYDYLAEGNKYEKIIPIIRKPIYTLGLWFVFAILILRKWNKKIKTTLFLALMFLGPILLAWGVSQIFTPVFYNRYLLYTIPPAMIVVGSNYRKFSLPLIALLLGLFIFIDWHYFFNPTKLPFREMGQYVAENRQEGDLFINWNGASHHLWETKYYGFDSPIYISSGGELPYFVGTALMEEDDIIREIPEGVQRLGVTTSGNPDEVNIEGFELTETKQIEGLKLLWFTKNE